MLVAAFLSTCVVPFLALIATPITFIAAYQRCLCDVDRAHHDFVAFFVGFSVASCSGFHRACRGVVVDSRHVFFGVTCDAYHFQRVVLQRCLCDFYRAHHDLGVLILDAPRLRGVASLRACKRSRCHCSCES